MKKRNVVKNNRDFAKIINDGYRIYNDVFSLYVMNNSYGDFRFGISVSKKIGNAVVRNKIKRQLRNIIDNYKNIYSKDKDYIIIVRRNYLNYSFLQIKDKYIELINKLANKKENKNEISK